MLTKLLNFVGWLVILSSSVYLYKQIIAASLRLTCSFALSEFLISITRPAFTTNFGNLFRNWSVVSFLPLNQKKTWEWQQSLWGSAPRLWSGWRLQNRPGKWELSELADSFLSPQTACPLPGNVSHGSLELNSSYRLSWSCKENFCEDSRLFPKTK